MSSPCVLSAADIQRDSSSYVDPHGYVFHYRDEIYRCVHPDAAPRYEKLLDGGSLEKLQSHGLVPTSRASLTLKDAPEGLILHHERIEPLSYCVEWCPSMLREAGLTTLDLAIAALDYDLMLQDAYPWNVLFDGAKAVFVDLTSLVPLDRAVIWPPHEQFEAFFYRPLALANQGQSDVARGLLYNNLTGISIETFYRLTSTAYHCRHPGLGLSIWLSRRLQKGTLKNRVRDMSERLSAHITTEVRSRFLKRLARRLEHLRFHSTGDPWENYYAEINEAFDKQAKTQAVRAVLTKIAPKSALDLGCNTGVFSIIAAECGARVVSVDSSEPCIELLFATARKRNLRITPLISDVLCPTPAYGFLGRQYPGLAERAKAEAVMCLGLMHHLHLTGRQSWDRIVQLLDTLSTRHLIFEFVGMDDANIGLLPQRREINYTLETVVASLRTRFRDVDVHPSDRETRRLLVCAK